MKTRTLQLTICATALATLLASCGRTEEPVATPTEERTVVVAVNAVCPIMEGEVDPDTRTVEYKGHVIGFCCPPCIPKWEEMTEEEKDAFLADLANGGHDHDG